jgi:uncharacterized protein YlzI (FlbEa/FlbD family)
LNINEGITDKGVDKRMSLPNFITCTINVDIENGIVTKVNQDIEDDEVYSYLEDNFEDGLKPFKNAGVTVDYTPWETVGFDEYAGGFFIDAESLNIAIKNNKIKIISDPDDDGWLVLDLNLNENPDPKKENRGAKLNTLHRAEELLNKYSIEKIKSNPELKTQLVNLNKLCSELVETENTDFKQIVDLSADIRGLIFDIQEKYPI